MSTPQLENGYTRIANELLEAKCRAHLNGSESSVFDFIIRQTYGYGKKERILSTSYIASGTDLPIATIKRSIKKLVERNMIIAKSERATVPKSFAINKNYKQWTSIKNDTKLVSKMNGSKMIPTSIKNDTKLVSKMNPNKRKNIKKELKKECVYTPTLENVILFFADRGFSEEQAKRFYDYNDALGWSVNGTKIKKWQVFAERWIEQERVKPQQSEHKTMFGKTIENKEITERQ